MSPAGEVSHFSETNVPDHGLGTPLGPAAGNVGVGVGGGGPDTVAE